MYKILVADDEKEIADAIKIYLEEEGYQVIECLDGKEALKIVKTTEIHLALLDIMMPKIDGITLAREIRKISTMPIIFISAKSQSLDKITGLNAGADDYITKPFAIEELLARVRNALKKRIVTVKKNEDILKCGLLSLDKLRHKVLYDNTEIELTNREFMLLKILMENKNIVLTRDVLMEKVCGYDYVGETNVIDVYIRYLRAKIDDRFNIKVITTVRGVGYVIKDE